jgi:hypothetical protein
MMAWRINTLGRLPGGICLYHSDMSKHGRQRMRLPFWDGHVIDATFPLV